MKILENNPILSIDILTELKVGPNSTILIPPNLEQAARQLFIFLVNEHVRNNLEQTMKLTNKSQEAATQFLIKTFNASILVLKDMKPTEWMVITPQESYVSAKVALLNKAKSAILLKDN